MCDSKPSPEMTTRFVVSVEQMVPYLENLCKVEEENGNDIECGDILIENFDNEDQLPNPIELRVTNEPDQQISDEMITYIDISMLNPIVEAYACLQKDELNSEGKTLCISAK